MNGDFLFDRSVIVDIWHTQSKMEYTLPAGQNKPEHIIHRAMHMKGKMILFHELENKSEFIAGL